MTKGVRTMVKVIILLPGLCKVCFGKDVNEIDSIQI